jgi:hypothetical protein
MPNKIDMFFIFIYKIKIQIMLRLPRDVIDAIFEFYETEYTVWIHSYKENDELIMKINTLILKKLNRINHKKIHNPIKENIIQLVNKDGIIVNLNVYTFTFTYGSWLYQYILNNYYGDYLDIDIEQQQLNIYLCEYSFYYTPYMKNKNIEYIANYITITKNNNEYDQPASVEFHYGYGAVLGGNHYYMNTEFEHLRETLCEDYIGYSSSYRLFPTIHNAKIYEFV